MAFLFYDPFDSIESLPDFGERGVERGKPEADVVRRAEVGDDVHFLDEGAVDAVAVRVADGDVRAALSRIPRGAEGKAQWGEPGIGEE